MKKIRRAALAGIAALGLAVALSACDPTDSATQPFNDAPVDKGKAKSGVVEGGALIVNMPDGFNNMAYKCVKNSDGSWTMFVSTYHSTASYGSIAVVQDAALCK